MATIIDVARYAGVSKSTVSLVLNNSPLVKEETRIHVEKAIQALGYVCNNNARGLRTKETKCLCRYKTAGLILYRRGILRFTLRCADIDGGKRIIQQG